VYGLELQARAGADGGAVLLRTAVFQALDGTLSLQEGASQTLLAVAEAPSLRGGGAAVDELEAPRVLAGGVHRPPPGEAPPSEAFDAAVEAAKAMQLVRRCARVRCSFTQLCYRYRALTTAHLAPRLPPPAGGLARAAVRRGNAGGERRQLRAAAGGR
jgi:hypothetical protein